MNQPNTQPALMAGVQDKVRERIQSAFMDLVPQELWQQMVEAELRDFTASRLKQLVREEAEKRARELLAEEFKKPEWASHWHATGLGPSEAVARILEAAAPQMVTALFGGIAQSIVEGLRSGSIRPYGTY